jgi:hypothetical protein
MPTMNGCGAWRQRRWAQSAARMVARARGEDTLSEPESLEEDDKEEDEEEEWEVTPPLHSHCARLFPRLVTSSTGKRGS